VTLASGRGPLSLAVGACENVPLIDHEHYVRKYRVKGRGPSGMFQVRGGE